MSTDDAAGTGTESADGADTADVDPQRLKEDLSQIKQAMGLQEQYPMAFQLWLLYGTLAVFASLGSQAVVTFDLSPFGHWLSWGGFYTLGYLYERFALEEYEISAPETKPSIRVQIAGVVGLLVAALFIVTPLQSDQGSVESQATIFGLILAAIGAIYIVQAASLRAYRIRARDRYAFYAGGIWMLAYGAVMPRIALLQEWGYAIFGILFAVHGIVSYIFLAR